MRITSAGTSAPGATIPSVGRSTDVAKGQANGEPLLRLAAERVGLRKAFRVLSYMVAWDMAREAIGHDPTTEEYGEHWRESRSTAFRDAHLFREAFPGEETPARLLALAGQQANARTLGAVLVA